MEQNEKKVGDYVARQYLGSMGKIEQGMSVSQWLQSVQEYNFSIERKVLKPLGTLEADKYKTK